MTKSDTDQVKSNPLPEMVGGLGFWGSWVWRKRKKGVKLMKYDF